MTIPPFKKALLLALAGALAATQAGCDHQPERDVDVTVIDGRPQLADPRRGPLTPSESALVTNAAQGLVRLDAAGQIVPGMAETWNVSDDGLSYIFRLASQSWPSGREITGEQVARMIRRLIAPSSRNPLKDEFSAVGEIVAMTERVIEIRLLQPQPHLLQLLAQPEMGLVYERQGSGPFSIDRSASTLDAVRLYREVEMPDGDESLVEQLGLKGATAEEAIRAFLAEETDLVLGGTFAALPLAQEAGVSRRALRFDPVSGLFGLVPARNRGMVADPELRQILSAAIDRDALVAALSVPGLLPRSTILEPRLDGMADPAAPSWSGTPLADRRAALASSARKLIETDEPTIRIALPEGPGSQIVLDRLAQDWGALGIAVERAERDTEADFKLVDSVAPSSSASWFVRRFRCVATPVCSPDVDELLASARTTPVIDQHAALLEEAAKRIDSLQLFIPLTAPVRWSLVSDRITGFAGNRFAIHTLTGLERRLERTSE